MIRSDLSEPAPLDHVVADPSAIRVLKACLHRPVHAYLLLGGAGAGTSEAAAAFAAELLAQVSPDPGSARTRTLAGVHPDLHEVTRTGPFITVANAAEVTRMASTSPLEGPRKVIVLEDFHLVKDAGPALLKTIEEPPASTIFLVLADYLPAELQTIASRCVTVEFRPLARSRVSQALIEEGVSGEAAERIAQLSGGRIDRARLLAGDPQLEERRAAWASVPSRLDGSGAVVAQLVDEVIGLVDSSVSPLNAAQSREAEELDERNRRSAEINGKVARGSRSGLKSGVKEMEERHARQIRRQRTDELRFGLSVLVGEYQPGLGGPGWQSAARAIGFIDQAGRNLSYNPGETLMLQALFSRLGSLR